MSKQKGFTLLELLVVIAIIGLLSTIAIVSYNNAQAKARDAKRMADLKAIQKAVDVYAFENGKPPVVTGTDTWALFMTRTSEGLLSYFNNTVPVDPTNDATYHYVYCRNNTNSRYFLYAQLERSFTGSLTGAVDTTAPDYYPATNQCVASNGGPASTTATPSTCDDTHFCLGNPFNQ